MLYLTELYFFYFFQVSDDFCDILVGKMTPLLFPYIFPEISEAIYIDRNIVFQVSNKKAHTTGI